MLTFGEVTPPTPCELSWPFQGDAEADCGNLVQRTQDTGISD